MTSTPPPETFVAQSQSDSAVRWSINRPERLNGIGPSIVNRLLELTTQVSSDLPLIIEALPVDIQSSNPIWIAGGDLIELSAFETKDDVRAFVRSIHRFTEWCENHPAPVIMLIDGQAIGGGAEISLIGDIRLATYHSSWNFKQGVMGLTTGFGGAHRLVELLGPTRSETLVYGLKSIQAPEALNLGLVHELARDRKELNTLADHWCQIFKQWHKPTFAAQKKMFQAARLAPPGSHRTEETQLFLSIWGNVQHKERMEQFLARKGRGVKP
jgi:enoyl-CoA hydratase